MAKYTQREAIRSHVARLLREERERQALSMTNLAEKSGLSQPMIGFVEQETRNPSLDTLLRITEALQVSLSDLIARATEAAQAGQDAATPKPTSLKRGKLGR